jgi:pimeloyl-ACP methyl ester carboxylesterase
VHGYKYAPGSGATCPHAGLFARQSRVANPRVISWPRHLQTAGPVIGFGWPARGGLRDVYRRAPRAGMALAQLVRDLRRVAPDRPVHVLSHSMGARVALAALPHLPSGALQTLLLLAAAEFRSVAAARLESPAGLAADVWHVTSGENALYDMLFTRGIGAPQRGDRALGTAALEGLTPIVLDDAATLARLARLGHRIAPPARRVCHWSPYLRGGVFGLYSAMLRGDLAADRLRRQLAAPAPARAAEKLASLPLRGIWPASPA